VHACYGVRCGEPAPSRTGSEINCGRETLTRKRARLNSRPAASRADFSHVGGNPSHVVVRLSHVAWYPTSCRVRLQSRRVAPRHLACDGVVRASGASPPGALHCTAWRVHRTSRRSHRSTS
jgi:hypothetical protein